MTGGSAGVMTSTPTKIDIVSGISVRAEKSAGDLHPDARFFGRLRETFGDHALRLAIGPLHMRLEGLSSVQYAALGERFSPFLDGDDPGSPDSDATIRLHPAGVVSFLASPRPGQAEIYRMESRRQDGRLAIWSYEFAGWLDAATRSGGLALVSDGGALFDRGLENFLRVMTASFILDRGGLLLHAAGVARHGRAYIFFGPSGSGKTTVANLSPLDTVLSDDLTLVVPHDGAFQAAGIPFGMAHHRVPQTGAAFPIAGLFRLVQSGTVEREPLGGGRALAEIGANLPFVMRETGQAERAIANAEALLRRVPAWTLRFTREDRFWNVIEAGTSLRIQEA